MQRLPAGMAAGQAVVLNRPAAGVLQRSPMILQPGQQAPGMLRIAGPGQPAQPRALSTGISGRNIVINQPGMTPLSVPLQTLQGLRPGQGIPTGQQGHLLVKTENGQYQILKVGSTQAAGSTSTTTTMHTRPPVQQSPQMRAPMPQVINRPTVALAPPAAPTPAVSVAAPAASSATPPRAPAATASSGGGGGMGQQMTPDTAKLKCKNFLATLLRLASEQPAGVAQNVRTLIQGLIDGAVDPEVFTTKLQRELNSSPQPCLVPFLKKSLPYLQTSLRSGELTIEGVRAPATIATAQQGPSISECSKSSLVTAELQHGQKSLQKLKTVPNARVTSARSFSRSNLSTRHGRQSSPEEACRKPSSPAKVSRRGRKSKRALKKGFGIEKSSRSRSRSRSRSSSASFDHESPGSPFDGEFPGSPFSDEAPGSPFSDDDDTQVSLLSETSPSTSKKFARKRTGYTSSSALKNELTTDEKATNNNDGKAAVDAENIKRELGLVEKSFINLSEKEQAKIGGRLKEILHTVSDGAMVPLLNFCLEESHVRKLCALKGIITHEVSSTSGFKVEDVKKEEPKEEPKDEPMEEPIDTDSEVDERMAEANADIEAAVRNTRDEDHGNDKVPVAKEYMWDRCEYDCRVTGCQEKYTTYLALQKHVKKVHKFKTATEYIIRFGKLTTGRKSVKCDCCKSIIKCSKASISRHLLRSHGMSLKAYEQRLADKGSEGPTPNIVEAGEEASDMAQEREQHLLDSSCIDVSSSDGEELDIVSASTNPGPCDLDETPPVKKARMVEYEWMCSCGASNHPGNGNCRRCLSPRLGYSSDIGTQTCHDDNMNIILKCSWYEKYLKYSTVQSPWAEVAIVRDCDSPNWQCTECHRDNFIGRYKCWNCGILRAVHQSRGKFSFGFLFSLLSQGLF